MLIHKGLWSAKGSVVFEGSSLGVPVEVDMEIVEDQDGITLTGSIEGAARGDLSIRIGADETGTYVLDARIASLALDGIAKLESEPNVCLLWNEAQTQAATASLFVVDTGIGCRGFFREAGKTVTWEILFRPTQQVVSGDNVVSMMRRR
ncbi:MAG TPA: hypothetical protein DE147_05935 [Gammaproteobacteria bacterium]|nr:hypothetical protein [Gammaproteobacteria bacterium]HCG69978.1 hypothetical protein [Gammaproteobacteria bacterium]